MDNAARGFKPWRDTLPAERAGVLSRLAVELRANGEEYAKLMTLEMGKPITQARQEMEKCAVLG